MKTLIRTSRNLIYYVNDETKELEPGAELVLILNDREYFYDGMSVSKRNAVSTERIWIGKHGLELLLKGLIDLRKELTEMEKIKEQQT